MSVSLFGRRSWGVPSETVSSPFECPVGRIDMAMPLPQSAGGLAPNKPSHDALSRFPPLKAASPVVESHFVGRRQGEPYLYLGRWTQSAATSFLRWYDNSA